jgi:excisionase family DNA binding protein
MSDETLLTPREAANKVGVTTQAVYLQIGTGKLRSVKKFGRILVARQDVERWRRERIDSAEQQKQRAMA